MVDEANDYPNASRSSKGNKKISNKGLSNEPQDQANQKYLIGILSDFKIPLNRRQLQIELHARRQPKKPELGSLCIPLIKLERENKISWIKFKCIITGNLCKHYFKLPYSLPLGTYWDWSVEDQKLVIRGKAVKEEAECLTTQH